MPRDSGGNYTLPAGNPVVTGTNITAAWCNLTLPDIGTDITSSLDRSGRGGMLAALKGIDGVVGAPAFSWTQEPTSGLYRASAGVINVAVLGVSAMSFTANGVNAAKGMRLGNAANADGTVLDWYEEGTFNPTVTFGGASVGLTYSATRTGKFTRVGNVVTYELQVGVSAKGSSVGTMNIGGLPYAAAGVPSIPNLFPNGGITPAGGGNIAASQSGTNLVMYRYLFPANASTMADTDVAAAFEIWATGTYLI